MLRPIRSLGSTEGALEEAGRAVQHITAEAAPNVLAVAYRGVRQASFAKTTSQVRNFLRACGHTHLSSIHWGSL